MKAGSGSMHRKRSAGLATTIAASVSPQFAPTSITPSPAASWAARCGRKRS
jgi:hypothetical protein